MLSAERLVSFFPPSLRIIDRRANSRRVTAITVAIGRTSALICAFTLPESYPEFVGASIELATLRLPPHPSGVYAEGHNEVIREA